MMRMVASIGFDPAMIHQKSTLAVIITPKQEKGDCILLIPLSWAHSWSERPSRTDAFCPSHQTLLPRQQHCSNSAHLNVVSDGPQKVRKERQHHQLPDAAVVPVGLGVLGLRIKVESHTAGAHHVIIALDAYNLAEEHGKMHGEYKSLVERRDSESQDLRVLFLKYL